MGNGSDFTVQARQTEKTWDVEGVPVLQGHVSLPELSGINKRCQRIVSFYRLQERAFLKYCQRELRPWAEIQYRAALQNSVPLPCYQASLEFRETCRAGRLWSLYTELKENAAPGATFRRRWGDTWDIVTGYPVALSDFFPPRTRWKQILLRVAADEIERQEKRGLAQYHPDWRRRVRRYFNPANYYVTGEGVTFYYPMYALAPAAEGVPCFLYPWDSDPPLKKFHLSG